MKKILHTLLAFFIFIATANAQTNKLTTDLFQAFSEKDGLEKYYKVNLILQQQVDYTGLNYSFIQNKTPLSKRAKTVIREAKELAETSQKPIIKSFNKNKVRGYKQYWIINMVSIEAKGDFILELAESGSIARIEKYGHYKGELHQPSKKGGDSQKAVNGIEPGLAAINATALWSMGYTGKGRKFFSIDTGVWPQHPALKDNFLGKHLPMNQAWHAIDSPLPRDKSGSHGTHTAGTVLGLDTTNNDTIGVAFNSYFMAADPIVVNLANIKPLPDYIEVFEHALNPDGDTSTTDDIPDAINNSWGIATHDDTSICSGYVTQMFNAVEAAGIANVFSAGNNGPSDTTIGQPQYVSTGLVNTFTVGAVKGNNPSFPITNFSSRGPTACPASGSIAIKPEVVAPGFDVRSSVGLNSYASYSGTSMAGPHATGACLLLKEAFPHVSGQDILMALYNSAIDLGVAGEDNTYGKGMIDVMAAYNYLDAIYTPVTPAQRPYDIAVKEIISPVDGISCNMNITPEFILENKGDSTITTAAVTYQLSDSTAQSTIWSGNLAPGETDTMQLSSFPVPHSYNLELRIKLSLDTSKKECDYVNNQRMKRFNIQDISPSYPYYEDFESIIKLDSSDWVIDNPDNQLTWDTIKAGGLPGSNISATVQMFDYGPRESQRDGLISPSITLPNQDSVSLKFALAYQKIHDVMADTMRVYISTDCGQSFDEIYKKGGDDLETYSTLSQDFNPSSFDQWRSDFIDITAYAGNNVLIKFETENRSGNNLYLDNIWVYDGKDPSSVENLPSTKPINLYPNPTSGILRINLGDNELKDASMELRDMLGNIVLQSNHIQNSKQEIDISNLPDAVYFLKFSNNSGVQTRRIIKAGKN